MLQIKNIPIFIGNIDRSGQVTKDSSKEFGDGIVKEVLPYILEKDDGRIKRATITKNGYFLPSYKYLTNYINTK